MIDDINSAWGWKGFRAKKIIEINDFGNVILKSAKHQYWRICPEEVTCKMIAQNDSDYNNLWNDSEFLEDWHMTKIIESAKSKMGELTGDSKYCLKIPALIGGKYELKNYGTAPFRELILFSGSLAEQTKDLPNRSKINFKFTD